MLTIIPLSPPIINKLFQMSLNFLKKAEIASLNRQAEFFEQKKESEDSFSKDN